MLKNYPDVELCLSGCRITDESLRHLNKCKILYLASCSKITDKGIKLLTNCRDLLITDCPQISNNCIQSLQKNGCRVDLH